MEIASRRATLTATVLATVALGGVAAAPVLSAGRADATPSQILRAVQRDLAKVRSYHAAGVLRDADGTTRLVADVTAAGSVRMRTSVSDQAFTLIKVGDASFLRGNVAYWRKTERAPAAVARRYANRWVRLPAASARALEPLYRELTPQHLARCTFTDLGTITKAGTGTVGGRKAVILEDKGDKPGSSPGRVWVTVAGAALPLRVVQTGPERRGGATTGPCADDDDEPDTTRSSELRYSRFDRVGPIRAPKNAVSVAEGQA